MVNKVVLVPFGEKIPLPKIFTDLINKYFFNGASDYSEGENPTTYTIKNVKFRNAICYEATSDEIYKDIDTNYVIAISNNGWFTPSIEPTLQKLLLQYYAKKYNLVIYHVTNRSQNGIIY
jgi:apolipoprotein N-acyltransferase